MNQPTASLSARPGSTSSAAGAPRIAIISSSWHRDIVAMARESLLDELRNRSPSVRIDEFEVPGSFEIPLHAKKLGQTGRYDALIACGLVVNGGIYRHEFVAATVIEGLMRVQLESEIPVLSAVLTPRDFHEHEDHHRFFSQHFIKKGIEVAQACLATLASLQAIQALQLPEVTAVAVERRTSERAGQVNSPEK